MPSRAPQVNFRPDDRLRAALAARAGDDAPLAYVARRDLERYYATLAADLRAVALTAPEALLIADAGNGTAWDAQSARLLWAEVADALDDGLAEKWRVDGPALVAKLRALSAGQALAVVDAIERAWRHPDRGEDFGAALRAVGLVR